MAADVMTTTGKTVTDKREADGHQVPHGREARSANRQRPALVSEGRITGSDR